MVNWRSREIGRWQMVGSGRVRVLGGCGLGETLQNPAPSTQPPPLRDVKSEDRPDYVYENK